MVEEALNKYNLGRDKCFMIGDKISDIECAKNANIRGYTFKEGNLLIKVKKILEELNFY